MGMGWDRSTNICHPDKKGCKFTGWLESSWKIVGWFFFKFFPAMVLFDCCMKSKSSVIVDSGGTALGWSEFIHYLRLWLLMDTSSGWSMADYWDKKLFDLRNNPCPYQLSQLMCKKRFNQITSELRFIDKKPPTYHAFLGGVLDDEKMEWKHLGIFHSLLDSLHQQIHEHFVSGPQSGLLSM